MGIDYDAISAWAAVLVAVVAMLSVGVEARRAAFSRGVDVLLKYSGEFSGPEFRERRQRFARMLRKKLDGKLQPREQADFLAIATYFLDHYETIGYLLRRGILDRQLTFVYYAYTFRTYWPFLKELIDSCQADVPTLWEDVEWLAHTLFRLSKRIPRDCIGELAADERRELDSFLQQELAPVA